jgi:chromosome partitioning protein
VSYVIACSNIKGGTAKTSTVTSLAGILAQQQYRVLVIDCDPQSNLTIALGINPDKLDKTLVEVISSEEMCFSEAIVRIKEGFDLIPAHMALHAWELRMVSMFSREKLLRRKLAEIRANYDFILLDCSPSINLLTINALTAADGILIPVQANSFFALYGMTQLMTTVNYIQSDPNPDLKVLGVVLTMSTNTKITREVSNQIKETFGDRVFDTIIRLSTRMAEAPAMGQTIGNYASESSVAEDYRQLAEEIKYRVNL